MINPQELLERIKAREGFSGYGSEARLAEFLGVSPQTLAGWRKRKDFDFGGILYVCENQGYDLHTVLTGMEHESMQELRAENVQIKEELIKVKGALEFCEKMIKKGDSETKPHRKGG